MVKYEPDRFRFQRFKSFSATIYVKIQPPGLKSLSKVKSFYDIRNYLLFRAGKIDRRPSLSIAVKPY